MNSITKSPLAEKIAAALAKGREANPTIPPAWFGKEHWSLLGYLETRCVDHRIGRGPFASIDREHLRCDPARHPGLTNSANASRPDAKYKTRLAEWIELPDHDDWDCLDDLETAGLVETGGTGINPSIKMTKLGSEVAGKLREHKANGGQFGEFRWDPATGAYSIAPKPAAKPKAKAKR